MEVDRTVMVKKWEEVKTENPQNPDTADECIFLSNAFKVILSVNAFSFVEN